MFYLYCTHCNNSFVLTHRNEQIRCLVEISSPVWSLSLFKLITLEAVTCALAQLLSSLTFSPSLQLQGLFEYHFLWRSVTCHFTTVGLIFFLRKIYITVQSHSHQCFAWLLSSAGDKFNRNDMIGWMRATSVGYRVKVKEHFLQYDYHSDRETQAQILCRSHSYLHLCTWSGSDLVVHEIIPLIDFRVAHLDTPLGWESVFTQVPEIFSVQ